MIRKLEKAPDFEAKNQNGNWVRLSDFAGKKLVLYFYPKDDTPSCTAESCNLRDNHHTFLKRGYEILGISTDSEKKHQRFINKYNLPFDLLADTDHRICETYGVWAEKQLFGHKYMGILRTTFIIDENGFIEKTIDKVNSLEHAGQILK
jgi:peroxiredoxin Q/BCP